MAPATLGGRGSAAPSDIGRRPDSQRGAAHSAGPGQDAVARLEASVATAPDNVAAGLRARLALFEAAGFLAHCGPAVHPHHLALRCANLTGSYTPRRAHRPAGSPMDDRLKAQARFLKADKPSR